MDSVPLKQLMKYFVNHLYPQNTSHDIPRRVLPRLVSANSSRRVDSAESVDYFRLLFAYTGLMFPPPQSQKLVVVQCKGCHENIPAPVESMPAQPIAAKCPLCHEHRRYLPSEVFLGPLSHRMIRKPVRTADGRVG